MSSELEHKTEKDKMLAGEWYLPGCKELTDDRKHCRALLSDMENSELQSSHYKEVAQKLFGYYGDEVFINKGFRCDYGYNISIGSNSEINCNCIFLDIGKIKLGRNVFIGPGTHIYAVNHPLDPTLRKQGLEIGKDVVLGDCVWLGGGVIVCPGVTIGEGTTIGAGSVVTKDIPANCLAVGNPAKVIKHITPS